MGFPSTGRPEFGGRALDALDRTVKVPYPTIDAETRRRVEAFIGCTLEQSFSEFTVELKNAVHRMLDDRDVDRSTAARHRRGDMGRRRRRRRAA